MSFQIPKFSIRSLIACTFVVSVWLALVISYTQVATALLGWTFILSVFYPFIRFQYWWFRDDTEVDVRIRAFPKYLGLFVLLFIAWALGPGDFRVPLGPDIFGLSVTEWYCGLWDNDIWWRWHYRMKNGG